MAEFSNFSQIYQKFQLLMENQGIAERIIKRYEKAFQKRGVTDEQIAQLKDMDPTLSPDYLKPTESGVEDESGEKVTGVGRKATFKVGSLLDWIIVKYLAELKPKNEITFPKNMSEEEKQAVIAKQNSEIERQMKMFWEDAYKYKESLRLFVYYTKLFDKQNINKFKDFRELFVASNKVRELLKSAKPEDDNIDGEISNWEKSKAINRKKYAKYYLGNIGEYHMDVYIMPKNMEISLAKNMQCDLATGTQWCTVPREGKHLESYLSRNNLYLFIGTGPEDRYQFYYGDENGEDAQFMDYQDEEILNKLI